MNLKQYITIMLLGTILCWVAWFFVVLNIDPFQDQGTGFGFFYISLAFAFVGTVSIISFLLRNHFSKQNTPMFKHVHRSFKDALFIAIVLVIMLFLQGKGYLNWWNTIILILAILLGAIFILSSKKNNEHINFK